MYYFFNYSWEIVRLIWNFLMSWVHGPPTVCPPTVAALQQFCNGPWTSAKFESRERWRRRSWDCLCGGGQEEAQVHQPRMTFPSAGVSSRWSPGESLQWPRGMQVDRGAKGRLDIKSGSCSLLTICCPGIMFPWMNPQTTDFKQSGNTISITCGSNMQEDKYCWYNLHTRNLCTGCFNLRPQQLSSLWHMATVCLHSQ